MLSCGRVRLSVCLFFCLSVMFVYCIETCILKLFTVW